MAKISGGSNSFLLRSLVQALIDTRALRGDKVGALIERFKELVNETDIAKRQPKDVSRHVEEIAFQLHPLADKESEPEKVAEGTGWPYPEKEVPSDPKAYAKAVQDTAEKYGFKSAPQDPHVDLTLDPAEIDLLLDDEDASMPVNPRSAIQSVLEGVADRFAASPRHPFIETVMHDGKRYVAVGTATIHSTKRENSSRSANCTVKNYRRIKDADESVLVHVDGRPMSASRDLPNGVCFVWLLHHHPGLAIRFWLSEGDTKTRRDNPQGAFRIILSDDVMGWRKAT